MADEVVQVEDGAALMGLKGWASPVRVRRWARKLEAIGLGRARVAEGQQVAAQVAALKLLLAYAVGPPADRSVNGRGPEGWRYRMPAGAGRMVEVVPVVGVPIDGAGRLLTGPDVERVDEVGRMLLGGGEGFGERGAAPLPDGGARAAGGDSVVP